MMIFCAKCLSPIESPPDDTNLKLVICEECYERTPFPDAIVMKRIGTEPTQASDTIRDMEMQMLQLRTAVNAANEIINTKKKFHIERVEKQWTDTKDKDLSNQTKRNNMVENILSEDIDYTTTKAGVEKDMMSLQLIQIDHSFEKRKFDLGNSSSTIGIEKQLKKIANELSALVQAVGK